MLGISLLRVDAVGWDQPPLLAHAKQIAHIARRLTTGLHRAPDRARLAQLHELVQRDLRLLGAASRVHVDGLRIWNLLDHAARTRAAAAGKSLGSSSVPRFLSCLYPPASQHVVAGAYGALSPTVLLGDLPDEADEVRSFIKRAIDAGAGVAIAIEGARR